jgi:hypothetical protein
MGRCLDDENDAARNRSCGANSNQDPASRAIRVAVLPELLGVHERRGRADLCVKIVAVDDEPDAT